MTEELRVVPMMSRVPSPTARDLAAVFFRHQRLFSISFVAVFAGMCGYGLLAPSYEAQMKVLVRHSRKDPASSPTLASSPEFARDPVSEEDLNSEAELFRDDASLQRVAQESGLVKHSWLDGLWGGQAAIRVQQAASWLNAHLSVDPVRKTNVIKVSYAGSDPETAARVLRCVAREYLQKHIQVHRPAGELEFFADQVEQSRQALQQAQLRVMNFTRDEGVVSAAEERDGALHKLSEAEGESRQTELNTAATVRRIGMLESQLRSLPERTTAQIRNSDNPELLGKLKATLLELQLKRTELLTKFEPSYRLVREVDQQIAETKNSIASEDHLPLRDQTTQPDPNREWAKSELVKAQVQLSGLRSQAATLSKQLVSYREAAHQLGDRAVKQQELLRSLKAAEEKYLLYMSKREEARVGDALDRAGILDVSIAQEPSTPALPVRTEWNYGLIGLVLGGMVSTGLAFSADYFDACFRTPDDVIACLGGPVLASLPRRGG